MRFTKIPVNTFKQLQMNAGIICTAFEPNPTGAAPNVEDKDILGATSGGNNFTAVPTFADRGEDIDNCPKNMAELKDIDAWEVKMSGTLVTATGALAAKLAAAADFADGKVTPRNTLKITDFADLWLVCDYGDNGMIAVKILNALSTGGFAIQTGDKAKGQFPYEFTGHYKMESQDTVPFEIYISDGATSTSASGTTGE